MDPSVSRHCLNINPEQLPFRRTSDRFLHSCCIVRCKTYSKTSKDPEPNDKPSLFDFIQMMDLGVFARYCLSRYWTRAVSSRRPSPRFQLHLRHCVSRNMPQKSKASITPLPRLRFCPEHCTTRFCRPSDRFHRTLHHCVPRNIQQKIQRPGRHIGRTESFLCIIFHHPARVTVCGDSFLFRIFPPRLVHSYPDARVFPFFAKRQESAIQSQKPRRSAFPPKASGSTVPAG